MVRYFKLKWSYKDMIVLSVIRTATSEAVHALHCFTGYKV